MTHSVVQSLGEEAVRYVEGILQKPSGVQKIDVSSRLSSRFRSPSFGAWTYFDPDKQRLYVNENVVGIPIEHLLSSQVGSGDNAVLRSSAKTALSFVLRGVFQSIPSDPTTDSGDYLAAQTFVHKGLSLVGAYLTMEGFIGHSGLEQTYPGLSTHEYSPCEGSGVEFETMLALINSLATANKVPALNVLKDLYQDGSDRAFDRLVQDIERYGDTSLFRGEGIGNSVAQYLDKQFAAAERAKAQCPYTERERTLGRIVGDRIAKTFKLPIVEGIPQTALSITSTPAPSVSSHVDIPKSVVELTQTTPRIAAKLLGGTSYVEKTYTGIPKSMQREGVQIDGVFVYHPEMGMGAISLNPSVAQTLSAALRNPESWQHVSADSPAGAAALLTLKSAAAVLLHENIHALGSSNRQEMAKEFVNKSSGYVFFAEGITELATRMNLDAYLAESGLDRAIPGLEDVPYPMERYVSQQEALQVLVQSAHEVSGLSENQVVSRVASAGGGQKSLSVLATLLLHSPSEKQVDATVHILEDAMNRGAKESSITLSDGASRSLGQEIGRNCQRQIALLDTELHAKGSNAPRMATPTGFGSALS